MAGPAGSRSRTLQRVPRRTAGWSWSADRVLVCACAPCTLRQACGASLWCWVSTVGTVACGARGCAAAINAHSEQGSLRSPWLRRCRRLLTAAPVQHPSVGVGRPQWAQSPAQPAAAQHLLSAHCPCLAPCPWRLAGAAGCAAEPLGSQRLAQEGELVQQPAAARLASGPSDPLLPCTMLTASASPLTGVALLCLTHCTSSLPGQWQPTPCTSFSSNVAHDQLPAATIERQSLPATPWHVWLGPAGSRQLGSAMADQPAHQPGCRSVLMT